MDGLFKRYNRWVRGPFKGEFQGPGGVCREGVVTVAA